jgi:hypothetical protein
MKHCQRRSKSEPPSFVRSWLDTHCNTAIDAPANDKPQAAMGMMRGHARVMVFFDIVARLLRQGILCILFVRNCSKHEQSWFIWFVTRWFGSCRRLLDPRHLGYDVTFVRNVTDIESWPKDVHQMSIQWTKKIQKDPDQRRSRGKPDSQTTLKARFGAALIRSGWQDHQEKSGDWWDCPLTSLDSFCDTDFDQNLGRNIGKQNKIGR